MNGSLFAKIRDIVLTVVVLVVAVIAIVWFIHTFNVFKLPDFVTVIFEPHQQTDEMTDEREKQLLNLFENGFDSDDGYELAKLTKEKASEVLSSIVPLDDFFWEVETTVSYADDTRTQRHNIYKRGDKVRIDTADEQNTTTVFSDGKVVIFNGDTGESTTFSGDTDFSYSNIINIASLEYALKQPSLKVADISLVDMDGEKYLFAEIQKSEINGVDKYLISLEHGIVITASSFIDGIEYYSQKTIGFDAQSIISDEAFDVSDLKAKEMPKHQ